ncbi:WD repeat-containing protein jip5 [Malassezia caprae]|uniref:WD repeat-containing protein JIP5 n=1 Tax=Malassezia caprae TaxID=1381934 RepID=A0AAF0E737_9BASI|nr:WD repeat-containing protein jip5 [Malassezia caprae]
MNIGLSSDALDVSFHPDKNTHRIAVGLISGKVQLFDYSVLFQDRESAQSLSGKQKGKFYKRLWSVRPSRKSCRGVAFDHSGSILYCIFKDKSLLALDAINGEVKACWPHAHDSAPSRLLPIDDTLVATGDDDGIVRIWDVRTPPEKGAETSSPLRSYDHHSDWITDMIWCPHLEPPRPSKKDEQQKRKRESEGDRSRLVVTSGDGTLSVIDVYGGKKGFEVSEDQEDELLSVAPIKGGKKLVVGTQLGILSLWAPSRGLLDHVDRFPGHPSSVDAICPLDDDTVLTGSSDGLIRVVQLFPHQLLGIVGDHDGMPVECLVRKGNLIASLGHGNECKLTDLTPLLEDDGEDADDQGLPQVLPVSDTNPTILQGADGSDSDDDQETVSTPSAKRRAKSGRSKKSLADTSEDRSNFFADL